MTIPQPNLVNPWVSWGYFLECRWHKERWITENQPEQDGGTDNNLGNLLSRDSQEDIVAVAQVWDAPLSSSAGQSPCPVCAASITLETVPGESIGFSSHSRMMCAYLLGLMSIPLLLGGVTSICGKLLCSTYHISIYNLLDSFFYAFSFFPQFLRTILTGN